MVLEPTQVPIVEIGVVVLAALMMGILFTRLRLSTTIGYILAGVILGPQLLGFLVPNQGISQLFGEIGLLLLLFYLGLELSIKKFKETGGFAIILSIVEMATPFLFSFVVAQMFGFNFIESLVIGTMLTATSTVMVSRFIFDRKLEKEPESRLILSILVVEDFFAILILAFIFSISHDVSFKLTLLNGVLFMIAMLFAVSRIMRFASMFFEKSGRSSVVTLFALGIGILVAYFSNYLGLTIALGAYFAGFALTETPYGDRIKKEIGFMREFFILFFFVSFGTTVVAPSVNSLLLVAVLVVAYVLAKIVAYCFFGVALGIPLQSAAKQSMLMIPIGEFSLIIAAAAAPFMKNPGELISLAFMLTLVSTFISPFMYDRSKEIADFISRVYPKRFRKASTILSKELHSLERASQSEAFQNQFSRLAESIAVNSVVALAIVYMSFLASFNIDLSFIPFLPKSLSINALILPLVFWPVYKAITDAKYLTYTIISNWSKAHFPSRKRHHETAVAASEIITSFILLVVGISASLMFYLFLRDLLLVPVLFTLLAVMYLSKSIYSLFEQSEDLESSALSGGISTREVASLSRELKMRSEKLSELNEERERAMVEIKSALNSGKLAKARSEMQQFKRRERGILENLGGLEKRMEKREFATLTKEERQTKKALEEYFLKQAPRILEEKRKGKKRR